MRNNLHFSRLFSVLKELKQGSTQTLIPSEILPVFPVLLGYSVPVLALGRSLAAGRGHWRFALAAYFGAYKADETTHLPLLHCLSHLRKQKSDYNREVVTKHDLKGQSTLLSGDFKGVRKTNKLYDMLTNN